MKWNRVFSYLAFGAMCTVAGALALCGATTAQVTHPAASGGFNGNWVNADAKTRNLARIEIEGMNVHPFGACSPTPCDWGVLVARGETKQDGTVRRSVLVAVHTTKAEQNTLTIQLEQDGRLSVNVLTHFTDNSGRKDYSVVNTMVRSTVP
ncbi:MAG TPA: hypothetical protein VJX73_04550 [Terracidiphilus sp.]|nr:hypothetical protein [Terracidiphilus sp.]